MKAGRYSKMYAVKGKVARRRTVMPCWAKVTFQWLKVTISLLIELIVFNRPGNSTIVGFSILVTFAPWRLPVDNDTMLTAPCDAEPRIWGSYYLQMVYISLVQHARQRLRHRVWKYTAILLEHKPLAHIAFLNFSHVGRWDGDLVEYKRLPVSLGSSVGLSITATWTIYRLSAAMRSLRDWCLRKKGTLCISYSPIPEHFEHVAFL